MTDSGKKPPLTHPDPAAAARMAQPPGEGNSYLSVNAGDNPRNVAAAELAKQLAARSGGKIKGEVYTNNQLAKGEAAQLEATQLGTIDIGPVGAAPIGGIFEPGFLAQPAGEGNSYLSGEGNSYLSRSDNTAANKKPRHSFEPGVLCLKMAWR